MWEGTRAKPSLYTDDAERHSIRLKPTCCPAASFRKRHEIDAAATTDANDVVKPSHPKAMPVILASREVVEIWLTADWQEAKALQRPLPPSLLEIVKAPAAREG